MTQYPPKDYLEKLYIKINHVATYEIDDPVEYVWHLFNIENGVYKDVFKLCGLSKKDIETAVNIFINSSNYKGVFSFGESMSIKYILTESKGIKSKSGLNKDEN